MPRTAITIYIQGELDKLTPIIADLTNRALTLGSAIDISYSPVAPVASEISQPMIDELRTIVTTQGESTNVAPKPSVNSFPNWPAGLEKFQPDTEIERLELGKRAYVRLRGDGIHTLGDLISRTPSDLIDIRGLGNGTLGEIESRLAAIGLHLKSNS